MFPSYYTGFADEAGVDLETQIRATRELGWNAIEMRNVRVPGFAADNLHNLPEEAFHLVAHRLAGAGVRVNSLGSTLGNWAGDLAKPFDDDLAAARRAADRARRLGAEFIRVMSYPIGDPAHLREEERFRRLRAIVATFAGTGTRVVHENCGNYGGMGWTYTLRLLENVPGLELVFDMGNCAGDLDYTKPEPRPRQDAWDFYQKVRAHIAYVHIKDAVLDGASGKKRHVFPGEGVCAVRPIVADLLARGSGTGLSIEPHMGAGLPAPELTPEANAYQTYVEYGRRLMQLVAEIAAAPAAEAR